jgi:hypothetical protein
VGYISPGLSATSLGGSIANLSTYVFGAAVDNDTATPQVFAGGGGGRIYPIDLAAHTVGTAHINSSASNVTDIYKYPTYISGASATSATRYGHIIYAWDETGTSNTYLGIYNKQTSAYTDAWKSGLEHGQHVFHPMIEWNGILWIGSGQYLAKLDGSDTPDGTLTAQHLDLGTGWEILALFTTPFYLGICASKTSDGTAYRGESAVFLYDGTSDDYTKQIRIEDNLIRAAYNDNGTIYLITENAEGKSILRRLTDNGSEKVKEFVHDIGTTETDFNIDRNNCIDLFDGKITMGTKVAASASKAWIWQYGRKNKSYPNKLTIPFSANNTTGYGITCLKSIGDDNIYMFGGNGTTYFAKRLSTNSSASAVWKDKYKDFGQKVRINYVKFYFKKLVSGDSVTIGLDVDDGTSAGIVDAAGNATIAYATDGEITSKKFKPTNTDCHQLRPTITYGGGDVRFSKIVVDYSYLNEDDA